MKVRAPRIKGNKHKRKTSGYAQLKVTSNQINDSERKISVYATITCHKTENKEITHRYNQRASLGKVINFYHAQLSET